MGSARSNRTASDRSKRVNRNREHVTKRIENGLERTSERARTPIRKREKAEDRHEPRINFARLTATVTSYINSKEGFPISVRASSHRCRIVVSRINTFCISLIRYNL